MRDRRRWFLAAFLVVFALVGAACEDDGDDEALPDDDTTTVVVTSAEPTESEVEDSPVPDISAGGPVITFTTGEAHVDITGDQEHTVDAHEIVASSLDPSTNFFTVTWEADPVFIGITGVAQTGETEASEELVVSISIDQYVFISGTGPCTVVLDQADESGVAGNFECNDLLSGDQTIDASGTFTAIP